MEINLLLLSSKKEKDTFYYKCTFYVMTLLLLRRKKVSVPALSQTFTESSMHAWCFWPTRFNLQKPAVLSRRLFQTNWRSAGSYKRTRAHYPFFLETFKDIFNAYNISDISPKHIFSSWSHLKTFTLQTILLFHKCALFLHLEVNQKSFKCINYFTSQLTSYNKLHFKDALKQKHYRELNLFREQCK